MAPRLASLGLACADVMAKPVNDWPEQGTLRLVDQLEMHLGGLAAVTATTFCALGGEAVFLGKVGRDGFGEHLVQAMSACGVDTRGVIHGERGTSSTVVTIDETGERTFLHYVGAAAEMRAEDLDWAAVEDAALLHWGGPAVTPGLDGEPMGRVFREARERGLATSFDTCFDGSGVWYPRIEHALPHTTIAMSSLEEAQQYTGCETAEAIADFYLARGPEVALVKLGPDGLFVKSASEAYRLPAHSVSPVDTTGAGDAACGGFLFGYLSGWDLERCAALANACGALTTEAMGGARGVASLSQAEALVNAQEGTP
jgi:sugar/nucleoside kinase (ribokinase family)